jgi:hypothetical protein
MWAVPPGEPLWRNPITGIAGCCARAASGHATAAPLPKSAMNSRRLMGLPLLRDSGRAKSITFGANGGSPARRAACVVRHRVKEHPRGRCVVAAATKVGPDRP